MIFNCTNYISYILDVQPKLILIINPSMKEYVFFANQVK